MPEDHEPGCECGACPPPVPPPPITDEYDHSVYPDEEFGTTWEWEEYTREDSLVGRRPVRKGPPAS